MDPVEPVVATRRERVEGIVYRAQQGIEIIDPEARTVQISCSSEDVAVRRSNWWSDPWDETLGHGADEVRMQRFENGGAPVLYNHMRTRSDRIGVVESAKLDGTRLTAVVRLSKRDDIDDIWSDILDGVLRNVSIGYQIHERTLMVQHDDQPDEYRVTDWEPMEMSFVDIPADPTVGVGRSDDDGNPTMYRVIEIENEEVRKMDPKDKDKKPAVTPEPGITAEQAQRQADDAAAQAAKDALANSKARRTEIRGAFEFVAMTDDLRSYRDQVLEDESVTPDQVRSELLKRIGKGQTPSGPTHVQPGDDDLDKFGRQLTNAIETRAGIPGVEIDTQNEVRGYTLTELARYALRKHGLDDSGERMAMVGRAFTMSRASGIGHSTSDFGNILMDVSHKSLLRGYDEAAETWQAWCRVGNLTDFKTAHRVGLSSFEDLEMVKEGGEYKYGEISDRGETITLATYGKIFAITRQAIINDDLSALTSTPEKMGRAAARVPGDLAYGVLTANPAMSDNVALFNAAHNNLGTAGAISVTTVSEIRTLMALQKDSSDNANGLNIQLGALLVPVALEDTARVLRESEYDPADANNSRAPNPHRNRFEVIADPRLDASSPSQYYGVAGPAFDTVEVAFLDGVQSPRMEEKSGWSVDGVETKVALDVAAAAMEHRSFVRNDGA